MTVPASYNRTVKFSVPRETFVRQKWSITGRTCAVTYAARMPVRNVHGYLEFSVTIFPEFPRNDNYARFTLDRQLIVFRYLEHTQM